MQIDEKFRDIQEILMREDLFTHVGKVKRISGMMIEATGSRYKIGDVCEIASDMQGKTIRAEVVGFNDGRVLLMPYEDIKGIGLGNTDKSTKNKLKIPVGDFLKGRIVDATGQPIDDGGEFQSDEYCYVDNDYINPLSRPRIDSTLSFGVKAIDGILTIGKGQRMGIFAGSGVGKSTLLGMVAKNVKADINVIALVGERGREVREFIEKDLGEEGLKRSVLVIATSDQPAMLRVKCALVATTIAEYFKDKGKDVLLMMDIIADHFGS